MLYNNLKFILVFNDGDLSVDARTFFDFLHDHILDYCIENNDNNYITYFCNALLELVQNHYFEFNGHVYKFEFRNSEND